MGISLRNGLPGAIRASWAADTSSDPDNWDSDNASYGQCAVSALVIQDHLGGELVRAEVCGVSHYWNRLPDEGTDLDLTAEQFPQFVLTTPEELRQRAYVLSFPATAARYELLASRVNATLSATPPPAR